MSVSIQRSFSKDENQGFAFAIYGCFTRLEDDIRHSISFEDMIKTLADIGKYGRHGAATLNAMHTQYCLRCYKRGKGKSILMEKSEEGPTGWKCLQCCSTEPKKRPLSTKHFRDLEYKMLDKLTIITESLPLYFQDIVPMYKLSIQNGPNVKQDFLKCFKDYEIQACNDSLIRRERWIITHYDPNFRSKRRQCSIPSNKIADIKIKDGRYSIYESSIAKLVDLIPQNIMADESNVDQLVRFAGNKLLKIGERLGELLKDLGWPNAYAIDKVRYDITSAMDKRYSQ
jgi:hypothetical protein